MILNAREMHVTFPSTLPDKSSISLTFITRVLCDFITTIFLAKFSQSFFFEMQEIVESSQHNWLYYCVLNILRNKKKNTFIMDKETVMTYF